MFLLLTTIQMQKAQNCFCAFYVFTFYGWVQIKTEPLSMEMPQGTVCRSHQHDH